MAARIMDMAVMVVRSATKTIFRCLRETRIPWLLVREGRVPHLGAVQIPAAEVLSQARAARFFMFALAGVGCARLAEDFTPQAVEVGMEMRAAQVVVVRADMVVASGIKALVVMAACKHFTQALCAQV